MSPDVPFVHPPFVCRIEKDLDHAAGAGGSLYLLAAGLGDGGHKPPGVAVVGQFDALPAVVVDAVLTDRVEGSAGSVYQHGGPLDSQS